MVLRMSRIAKPNGNGPVSGPVGSGGGKLGMAFRRLVQHGAPPQRAELRDAAAASQRGSAGDHAATQECLRSGPGASSATLEPRDSGLVTTGERVAQSRESGQARSDSGRVMEPVSTILKTAARVLCGMASLSRMSGGDPWVGGKMLELAADEVSHGDQAPVGGITSGACYGRGEQAVHRLDETVG